MAVMHIQDLVTTGGIHLEIDEIDRHTLKEGSDIHTVRTGIMKNLEEDCLKMFVFDDNSLVLSIANAVGVNGKDGFTLG